MKSDLPKRKQSIHGVVAERNKPTIVFVTACTENRRPWLANAELHQAIVEVWARADAWFVGRYVIMPDHVHMFVAPGERDTSLERWMSYWKFMLSKRLDNASHRWQRSHWDTRLRSSKIMAQSGAMCEKTPSEKVWSHSRTIGHTKERSMNWNGRGGLRCRATEETEA